MEDKQNNVPLNNNKQTLHKQNNHKTFSHKQRLLMTIVACVCFVCVSIVSVAFCLSSIFSTSNTSLNCNQMLNNGDINNNLNNSTGNLNLSNTALNNSYAPPKNLQFNSTTKTLTWDPVSPIGTETVKYNVFYVYYRTGDDYIDFSKVWTSTSTGFRAKNITETSYTFSNFGNTGVIGVNATSTLGYSMYSAILYEDITTWFREYSYAMNTPDYVSDATFQFIEDYNWYTYGTATATDDNGDEYQYEENKAWFFAYSEVQVYLEDTLVKTIYAPRMNGGVAYENDESYSYVTDEEGNDTSVIEYYYYPYTQYYQQVSIRNVVDEFGSGNYKIRVKQYKPYEHAVCNGWSEFSSAVYLEATATECTVTYDATENGGTFGASGSYTSSEVLTTGDSVDLDTNHRYGTKSGWTFVGWNTDKNATTALASLTVSSSDITLYAIYKKEFNIEYYQVGATSASSTTAVTLYNKETSKTVTAPTIASLSGKIIVGWGTSTTATTSAVSSGGSLTVSDSATYYAIYKISVTITYNSNGGSGSMDSSTGYAYLTANKTTTGKQTYYSITLPDSGYTKTGYVFVGWGETSSTIADEAHFAGEGFSTMSNVTLYAIWEEEVTEYTITYNSNGGTFSDGTTSKTITGIPKDTLVIDKAPELSSRTGYRFLHWSNTTTGSSYNNKVINQNNATYYAVWQAITYTVTFNANGGTIEGSTTKKISNIEYGKTIAEVASENSIVPTKTDYNFAYWTSSTSSDQSANNFVLNSTTTFSYTVYAYWATTTYTVTLNANGGTFSGGSNTMVLSGAEGNTINNITPGIRPTYDGHTFKFWSTTSDSASATNCGSNTLTGNITIYAIWYDSVTNVTITFNAGSHGTFSDGTTTKTMTVTADKYVWEVAPEITATGNAVFKFWAKQTSTSVSEQNNQVEAGVTYYAQYETTEVDITISFDSERATGTTTITSIVKGKAIYVSASDNKYVITTEDSRTYEIVANSGYSVVSGFSTVYYASSGLVINLQFDVYKTPLELRLSSQLVYTYTGEQIEVVATLDGVQDGDTLTLTYIYSSGLSSWTLDGSGVYRYYYNTKNADGSINSENYIPFMLDEQTGNWYYNDGDITRTITNQATSVGNYIAVVIVGGADIDKYVVIGNPTCTFSIISQTLSAPINIWWDETEPGLARWDSVSAPVSSVSVEYTVKLYRNSTLVNTITSTDNKYNFNDIIKSYTEGGVYTFSVTSSAGSSTDVVDSEESSQSSSLYATKVTVKGENTTNITSVSFNGSSSSSSVSKVLIAGENGISIGSVVASGLTFSRWEISNDGIIIADALQTDTTISLDAGITSTEAIVVTAKTKAQTAVGSRIFVYLNANGGTVSPEFITINHVGVNVTSYANLPTPQREGYDFVGWFISLEAMSSDSNAISNGDKVTVYSDHTLYAKWSAQDISLTINAIGTGDELTGYGTYSVSGTTTGLTITGTGTKQLVISGLKYGDTISANGKVLSIATYASGSQKTVTITLLLTDASGYTTAFNNYLYNNSVLSSSSTNLNVGGQVSAVVTRSAQTYTITFNTNGGSLPSGASSTMQVTYASTYGNLPTPTNSGYYFMGWYLSTTYSEEQKVTSLTKVATASNHTLYARWEAIQYCTITAYLNDTTGNASFINKSGWTIAKDGKTATCDIAINEDTTINQTYGLPGSSYSALNFKGWFVSSTGNSSDFIEANEAGTYVITAGTSAIKIYANWLSTYTIKIYLNLEGKGNVTTANGWTINSDIATKAVTIGSSVTFPVLTKSETEFSYKLTGFYNKPYGEADATSYGNNGSNLTPTEDITLYAWWQAPTIKHYFYSDDSLAHTDRRAGNFENATVKWFFEGDIFYGPSFKKTHYKFSSWTVYEPDLKYSGKYSSLVKVGTLIQGASVQQAYSGKIFIPIWEPDYITVYCDMNGKGSNYSCQVFPGNGIGAPSGYTGFLGWFTEATGGSEVTSVYSSCTVYAHWSNDASGGDTPVGNSIIITLDANGGTCSRSSVSTNTGKYPNLPTATPPNGSTDKFIGWFTEATGGTLVSAGNTLVQQSAHTLYAHYANASTTYTVTAISMCSVQFTSRDGWTGSSTQVSKTFSAGVALTPPSVAKPTGTDWSTSSSTYNAIPSAVTSDITIYLINTLYTVEVVIPSGWSVSDSAGFTEETTNKYVKKVNAGSALGTLPTITNADSAKTYTWSHSPSYIVNSFTRVTASVVDPENQIRYTIKCYIQSTSTLIKQETNYATVNANVTVQAPTIAGYTCVDNPTYKTVQFNPLNTSVSFYYTKASNITISVVAGDNISSVSGGGTYASGDLVTISATVKDDCVFDGWYVGTTRVYTSLTATLYADSNTTYTAKAVEKTKYTISVQFDNVNYGSASPSSVTVNYGTKIIVSSKGVTADGVTLIQFSYNTANERIFSYFTIDDNITGTLSTEFVVTQALTSIKVFTTERTTRTVVYHYKKTGPTDTSYSTSTVNLNKDVTFANGFVGTLPSGYSVSWHLSSETGNDVTNSTINEIISSVPSTGTIHVYGVYTASEFTITLNARAKSGWELISQLTFTAKYNSLLTFNGNAVTTSDTGTTYTLSGLDGYTYSDGWSQTVGAQNGTTNFQNYVTGDATYYLLLTKTSTAEEYVTLTVKPNNTTLGKINGSSEITVKVKKGDSVNFESTTTTINGQTVSCGQFTYNNTTYLALPLFSGSQPIGVFTGWSSSLLTLNSDTVVTANFTEYAQTYSIEYVLSDGNGNQVTLSNPTTSYTNSSGSQSIQFVVSSSKLNNATFKGFTAITSSNVTLAVTGSGNSYTLTIPANTTGEITVTAVFTASNQYTITYETNGGSFSSLSALITKYTSSTTSVQSITIPALTKDGYKLTKWATDNSNLIVTIDSSNSSATLTIPANYAQDITLSAEFTKISSIGEPTNLRWEVGMAMWDAPEGAPANTMYKVSLYKNESLQNSLTTTNTSIDLASYLRTQGMGTYYFKVSATATIDGTTITSSEAVSSNTYVSQIIVAKDTNSVSSNIQSVSLATPSVTGSTSAVVITGESYTIACTIKSDTTSPFGGWKVTKDGTTTSPILGQENQTYTADAPYDGSYEIKYTAYLTEPTDITININIYKRLVNNDTIVGSLTSPVDANFNLTQNSGINAQKSGNTLSSLNILDYQETGFVFSRAVICNASGEVIKEIKNSSTEFDLEKDYTIKAYFEREQYICKIYFYDVNGDQQTYTFGKDTDTRYGYYGTTYNVKELFEDGTILQDCVTEYTELALKNASGGSTYNAESGMWVIQSAGELVPNTGSIAITEQFMGTNGSWSLNNNNGYTATSSKLQISGDSISVKLSDIILNSNKQRQYDINKGRTTTYTAPNGVGETGKIYAYSVTVGSTTYSEENNGTNWLNTSVTIKTNASVTIKYARARYSLIVVFPKDPSIYPSSTYPNTFPFGKDGAGGDTDGYWGSTEVISDWTKVKANITELTKYGLTYTLYTQSKTSTTKISVNGEDITLGTFVSALRGTATIVANGSNGTVEIKDSGKSISWTVGTNDAVLVLKKNKVNLTLDYNLPDGSDGSISANTADSKLSGYTGQGKFTKSIGEDMSKWINEDGFEVSTTTNKYIMGYVFKGWYSSATGGTAYSTPQNALDAGLTTVYAQWRTILPVENGAYNLSAVDSSKAIVYMSRLCEEFIGTELGYSSATYSIDTGDEINLNSKYDYVTISDGKLIATNTYFSAIEIFSGTLTIKESDSISPTILLNGKTFITNASGATIQGTLAYPIEFSGTGIAIESATNATISYISRIGSYTDISETNFGGIVCSATSSTISYCTNSMTIAIRDDAENYGTVGGIVGYQVGGTISNCTNNANISNNVQSLVYIGGIVGKSSGSISSCTNTGAINTVNGYAGGIVGETSCSITSCTNSGTITASANYVGGIVGNISSVQGISSFYSIISCNSSGSVSGKDCVGGIAGYSLGGIQESNQTSSSATISGREFVGGIAGRSSYLLGTVAHGRILSCNAQCIVEGNQRVGGIVGHGYAVTNCESRSNVRFTTAYDDEGTLLDFGYYFGGIAGMVNNTMKNCTYSYTSGGYVLNLGYCNYVGGIAGQAYCSIDSCTIPSSGTVVGRNYVGGYAGSGTTIFASVLSPIRCYLNITGNNYVGGFMGKSAQGIIWANNIKDVSGSSYVGGIVGYGDCSNCTNSGNISGTTEYIGGITGFFDGEVTGCTNTGTISASSANYVGGIAGKAVAIYSCVNREGFVKGYKYVGGIAGEVVALNKVTLTIDNSATTSSNAMVMGTTYVGGLAGKFEGAADGMSFSENSLFYANSKFIASGNSKVGALFGGASIYSENDLSTLLATMPAFETKIYVKNETTNGYIGTIDNLWGTDYERGTETPNKIIVSSMGSTKTFWVQHATS